MLKHKRYFIAISLFLVALWVLSPRNGWSQSVYGKMSGTVTDSNSAVLPGAAVTLTNLATGEKRAIDSDAAGDYTFVNILPGRYRLEAQKTGFKQFRREPVVVEIESGLKVDISMQVGSSAEVVQVTAETPLLQPETNSLGQVIESRPVTELPLNGRNPLAFVALVPGVVPQGNPSSGNSSTGSPVGANVFALGAFQIGGGQAGQSSILLDGVSTNGGYLNVVTVVPTQDAIQEFKVQTNNMGPEYGRFAGGVINLSTKSGANNFHGSIYEFLRNKVLNSNDYFAIQEDTAKAAYEQNQFGGNAGGRIVRDKLFFFSSYEGYRQSKGNPFTGTMPTALMREGNFSEFTQPIYDPLTSGTGGNAACAAGNGACRTAFPGNIIPAARLDPSAVAMLKYFPMPTKAGTDFNYFTHYSSGGNIDEYNERMDWNASEKQRVFGRYTRWNNLSKADNPFTLVCSDRCNETIASNQIALGDTISLTPKTILDPHLGYTRFVFGRTPLSEGIDLSQFGSNWGALSSQVGYTHLPDVCISQSPGDSFWGNGWCSGGTGSGIGAHDDTYSATPSVTTILGRHTLKVGWELRVLRNNYFQTNQPSGFFNFDAGMSSQNPFNYRDAVTNAVTSGVGFASFLLGDGANGSVVTPSRMATQLVYNAFYGGDTFQVSRKLTLNLGVRVDLQGSWTERFNRIIDFLPNAPSPLAGGAFPSLKGAFSLVDTPQHPSRSSLDPWRSVSPRVGLSYQLDTNTVIRTGYGMFYLPVDVRWNDAPHNLFINTFTQPWLATLDSIHPNNPFSNPFPGPTGIIQPAGRSQMFINEQGNGVSAPLTNTPPPYVQQWNFNIQRQLPGNALVDIAYAGSKGTHLPMHSQDLDQLPATYFPGGGAGETLADLTNLVPNPFFGEVESGNTSQAMIQGAHLLYPYPQYDDVSVAEPDNRDSIYHSMQLKFQKRLPAGATILASYTLAKLISDTNNEINWLGDAAPSWGDANAYNIRGERSLDGFDVPQRLVIASVLDLPFGHGKKFAGNATGLANGIIGGWGVNTIMTFQSGYPLSMQGCDGDISTDGIPNGGCPRATRTALSHLISGPLNTRLNEWFDTSVFTPTVGFGYGTDSRTEPNVRSQGVKNVDFAAFKNTGIGPDGKLVLQFRAEIFNIFNRTQFSAPDTNVSGDPNFGVIPNSQYNLPRIGQVALRLSF